MNCPMCGEPWDDVRCGHCDWKEPPRENSYITAAEAKAYLKDPIEAEMFRRQTFGDWQPREKTKFVIAQNRNQYREFCEWAHIDWRKRRDDAAILATAEDFVEDLSGRTPDDLEIVVIGVPRWWREEHEARLEALGFELPHAALNVRDVQLRTDW